jgi:hypothetical protein
MHIHITENKGGGVWAEAMPEVSPQQLHITENKNWLFLNSVTSNESLAECIERWLCRCTKAISMKSLRLLNPSLPQKNSSFHQAFMGKPPLDM